MSSMTMADHTMMMSSMMMTFYTSTSTSLYTMSWTPSSTAQYAGTCIFLIALSVIFRSLFALRRRQERKWAHAELKRHPVFVDARNKKSDGVTSRDSSPDSTTPVRSQRTMTRPWRISTDVPRAILDTIIAGVGYLLMLAVMTMNVGYFLSILGGVFLGSLLLGRYAEGPGFGLH
ncbi:hypothetical protein N7G274_006370 [Stereocaulon virgatum]|uniref:Copper transport protein n=1 Tax=Stereocaulon virgatum TaxID=373712 RepID=A0ABR4A4R8_9LECA